MKLSAAAFSTLLLLGLVALALGGRPQSQVTTTRIVVESQPSGAEFLVNGQSWGRTPLANNIRPGKHQFQLRRQGYQSQNWSQFCSKGTVTRVARKLPEEMAQLKLRETRDAELWLGPGVPQKLTGKGPWKLPAGRYEITAQRQGIPSLPQKLELKAGETREVALQWPSLPSIPQAMPSPPPALPSPPRPSSVPPPAVPAPPAPAPPVYRRPQPNYQAPRPAPRPAPRVPSPPPAYQPPPRPLWTPIPPPVTAPPTRRPTEPLFTPLP